MKNFPNFKGSYKNYYNFIRKKTIFENRKMRIIKNFYNLGLWLVKDAQGRHTLNLFIIRIQF